MEYLLLLGILLGGIILAIGVFHLIFRHFQPRRFSSIFLCTVVSLLVPVMILFSIGFIQDYKLNQQAREIAEKVRQYEQINNRLPDSLEEVGVKETERGPIFYEKKGTTTFELYHSEGFDEGRAYHPETDSWETVYP